MQGDVWERQVSRDEGRHKPKCVWSVIKKSETQCAKHKVKKKQCMTSGYGVSFGSYCLLCIYIVVRFPAFQCHWSKLSGYFDDSVFMCVWWHFSSLGFCIPLPLSFPLSPPPPPPPSPSFPLCICIPVACVSVFVRVHVFTHMHGCECAVCG